MITIKVDTMATQRALRAVAQNQLPFAISQAINKTAIDAQGAQRTGMQERFTIRRPSFVLRAVKIKPFARKDRLYADILIDPPGGQARADILAKFEEPGIKRPRTGSRIAIPNEVRRGKTGVIPRSQRLSAFNFRAHKAGGRVFSSKGTGAFVGDKRTIMIRKPGGKGVVLQRVGRRGSTRLKVLYIFRPQVRIDPLLQFEETITGTVQRVWASNFEAAYARAVLTGR